MFKVSGVTFKQGNFKDGGREIAYANYYLHCVASPDKNTLAGFPCEILKVQEAVFLDESRRLNVGVSDLIGADIRPYYDKYAKVCGFDILEPAKK